MDVEVWGEIAPETKAWFETLGIPGIKYHNRKCGFTGMFNPRVL